jgi:hypothetical protein
MKLLSPPPSVRDYLNFFLYEPADETTIRNIKQGLLKFYPDENLTFYVGYDYYGYLDVRFEFNTEEDAVVFKLKYGL